VLLERCRCSDLEQVLELLQRMMPLLQLPQGAASEEVGEQN
jgi:hypothetical protein